VRRRTSCGAQDGFNLAPPEEETRPSTRTDLVGGDEPLPRHLAKMTRRPTAERGRLLQLKKWLWTIT
jgi:hypothetical protein